MPAFAVTVIVEELPVVPLGLKLALAPLGNPEALNVTAPLNPCVRSMNTVKEALLPCTALMDVGLAQIEKSPGGGGLFWFCIVSIAAVSPILPTHIVVLVPVLITVHPGGIAGVILQIVSCWWKGSILTLRIDR